MDLPNFVQSDWFGAAVLAGVTWLGHQIWNRTSDTNQKKLAAAIGEARSVIAHLRDTATDDTTVEQFIVWAKGAAAIQLAKVGISVEKNSLARAMVNEVVAGAALAFAQTKNKLDQAAPILAKLK